MIVNPPNKHRGRLIDIAVVVDHGHVGVGVGKTRNNIVYAENNVRTSSSTQITPFQLAAVCNFM